MNNENPFADHFRKYLEDKTIPSYIHEAGFPLFILSFMAGLDNMYKKFKKESSNPEQKKELINFLCDVSDELDNASRYL